MATFRNLAFLLLCVIGVVAHKASAASLHCYWTDHQDTYWAIHCDWDDPDDCANQEPAWDKCVDLCSGQVDYQNTYGWACGTFTCNCTPID